MEVVEKGYVLRGKKQLIIDGFSMYVIVIVIFWNFLDWKDYSFDVINVVIDDDFLLLKE